MYTVIRNYSGAPTLADELKNRSKDIEALIGTVPGFIAYYLIKSKGGAVSVTVCDDERGCGESSKRAADYLRQQLPNLKIGTPEITEGELLFKFTTSKTAV